MVPSVGGLDRGVEAVGSQMLIELVGDGPLRQFDDEAGLRDRPVVAVLIRDRSLQ